MKTSILYLFIFLFSGTLMAQEEQEVSNETIADTTAKVKLNREERVAFRKEKVAKYKAWEMKHFNSPGKWYIGIEAGYGFPFLTTEPEAVPPVTFLGSSDFFQGATGVSYDKLLLSGQGGGFRTSLTVGKMFNHFVGLEFKLGYFAAVTDNLSTVNTPNFKATLNTDLFELQPIAFVTETLYTPAFKPLMSSVIDPLLHNILVTGLADWIATSIAPPLAQVDFCTLFTVIIGAFGSESTAIKESEQLFPSLNTSLY